MISGESIQSVPAFRRTARAMPALLGVLLLWPLRSPAQYTEAEESRPERMAAEDFSADEQERGEPIAVRHSVIEAELVPPSHTLRAKAEIRFQALEEVSSVEFELNSNLFPKNITGEDGQVLSAHRPSNDLTLRISLGKILPKDQTAAITIEFEGQLADAEHSPVEGVQLAYIGEEGSYLLYPARWFPVSGYGTNRFTAELHLIVPPGFNVVAGGKPQPPVPEGGNVRYSFTFDQPQFPGSLAVVTQQPQVVEAEGRRMNVYFSPAHEGMAETYGEAAARMVNFFASRFGPPLESELAIVEMDDRSLGGYAGPGTIFLASRAIGDQLNLPLLAQEVAQQWWRGLVSPARKADMWLDHGLATYSEILYQEHVGGEGAITERMREVSIDALTYDSIPMRAAAGRLAEFSPAYHSILYAKSSAALHMLRWVIGEEAFFRTLREFVDRFAFQAATTGDFRRLAEQASSQNLDPFFLQWTESTGASDFKLDYVIYRAQDGFKVVGKVEQDMDVFSMPVEIKVETDGEPVTQRVDVTGKSSEFSIQTFGRPRKIILDPNNRLLKYNDAIRVRVAIARGEQAAQQRDFSRALEEYQRALDLNRTSSLAHYRVGEAFFQLRNYQSAANAFREALNGDLEPKWTEVWSHVSLGKIFDVTGQRDRAVNEYQQAIRTKDDSQGALAEANRYLQQPYQRTGQQAGSGG